MQAAVARGTSFGTPTEGEVALAEEIVVARRARRAGAAGVQRHRGDDVGDPAGPRLHRPHQGGEVRRLLPRPRRRAARRGRLRRRDPRACRTPPASPARQAARHDRAAVQRPRRGRRRRSRDTAARSPASSPRPPPATWASSRRCPGFNAGLAELCRAQRRALISDEVMTGFRVSRAGWFGLDGVRPDLMTFGKVMGGGFPAAAFGGRADVMAQLAPAGPVYQAGTLSGNPVATAAGLATLRLARPTRSTPTSTRSPRELRRAGQRRRCATPAWRTGCSTPATCSRSSSPTDAVRDYDDATPQDAFRVHGVLPRDARAGRLPAAVGVRGLVRLRRPRRRRARAGSPTRCPPRPAPPRRPCRRTA